MIKIQTSHNDIYNISEVTADIINEYQVHKCATIFLNHEGPSAASVGLYNLLDYVCETFNFNKTKIKIITCNEEEFHNEYKIEIRSQHWIKTSVEQYYKFEFSYDTFKNRKNLSKNLFGCLYNIPSWNRLAILSYLKLKTNSESLLACNITLNEAQHNTLALDKIITESPGELFNIIDYLKTNPTPLPGHPGHKPEFWENMEITKFYNEFFVDIVAETYTDGLTFFVTEKTIRPMLALTPFIIFGPQGFLSNLKARFGFKTFDQWWDESYDNFSAYERIKKMYKIIDFLDSLTIDDRKVMYKEMQAVLDDNFNKIIKLYKNTYK